MRKNGKKEKLYGIIGLGRFGSALARTLAEQGEEIIVVDQDENVVREMREYTDNAFVTSDLSRESLREMGFDQCSCVAVCMGERIDTNILTSLNCVSLGVEKVIAKAVSLEHGEVLAKLGVEGVYPEHDMAVRLGRRLTTHSAVEYIELRNEIEITQAQAGAALGGMRVDQSGIRRRYGLSIIAIERETETIVDIRPDTVLDSGDRLILIGKSEDIRRFEEENR
ncbi:MAG: TrkA family potassium uptake protein [Oscillospiraceae bacterium]|nr:TrkA family potassium uptake protein [Oscillospiraceae bacterium]